MSTEKLSDEERARRVLAQMELAEQVRDKRREPFDETATGVILEHLRAVRREAEAEVERLKAERERERSGLDRAAADVERLEAALREERDNAALASLGAIHSPYCEAFEGRPCTRCQRDAAAEQNRALQEALRYYANKENWREDDWNVRSVIQGSEYGNPGRIARAALGESE